MTITIEAVILGGAVQLALLVISFFLGEVKANKANDAVSKKEAKAEAIRAYRSIMGMRITVMQELVSRYEATIIFMYHERRWVLAGMPKDSIDLSEAERWQHKSEDRVDNVTAVLKDLYENCATLSIYFKSNKSIQALIDEILEVKTFRVNDFNKAPAKDLDNIRDRQVLSIQQLVEMHYSVPIKKLLSVVKVELF